MARPYFNFRATSQVGVFRRKEAFAIRGFGTPVFAQQRLLGRAASASRLSRSRGQRFAHPGARGSRLPGSPVLHRPCNLRRRARSRRAGGHRGRERVVPGLCSRGRRPARQTSRLTGADGEPRFARVEGSNRRAMIARVGARRSATNGEGASCAPAPTRPVDTRPVARPLVVFALLSTSCVLGPAALLPSSVTAGVFCPSQSLSGAPRLLSPPEEESPVARVALERGYSPYTLETARTIGAQGLVERLAEARAQGLPDPEVVSRREKVVDAISMATLDLASTVAHIECEEGRASEIAANLRDAEGVQTRKLTAFSRRDRCRSRGLGRARFHRQEHDGIEPRWNRGGLAGGALGFATLAVHRTADFRHSRNILAELWYGKEHPDFPEAVWAHLTRPQPGIIHASTIRQGLIDKWKASGLVSASGAGPSSARAAALLRRRRRLRRRFPRGARRHAD